MGSVRNDGYWLFYGFIIFSMVGVIMSYNDMTTAEKIKTMMGFKDLTIKQLSGKSGIPYMTVWQSLNNGNEPSHKNFVKMAEACGYKVEVTNV